MTPRTLDRQQELPRTAFALDDPFWSPRRRVNATHAIFHQWEQLEASGCIANFRLVAGEISGWREGWFFADSDAYKWLDAASLIQAELPQQRLAALLDDFIALLGRAQCDDGYLFTYNQLHFPGVRWANLQIEHELYCHGHLIEAGVSHHTALGRDDLLTIACRAADLLVRDFAGAGHTPGHTPGHEEIEIALLRLHQVSGRTAYFDLAHQFLEQRGRTPRFALSLLRQMRNVAGRGRQVAEGRRAYLAAHPDAAPYRVPPGNAAKRPRTIYWRWLASALSGKYFQQHAPIRRQNVPVGHAVRFGYLQTAVAMLARASGDDTLLPALFESWERLVTRRLYVTGGAGALPALEGFGRDDELDPEFAYAETCAALAGIFWNWQMALLSGEARFGDLLEWQLYNAAAVGMGLAGDAYFYNNPLTCRGGVVRKPWFAVPCCPSNLSRVWADLGRYALTVRDDEVTIQQWFSGRGRLPLRTPVGVVVASGLPWRGEITLRLEPAQTAEFGVRLRLPSWAGDGASLRLNGQPVALPALDQPPLFGPTAGGFDPRLARWVTLRRRWAPGDEIALKLPMAIMVRRVGPRVRGHVGKVALTRGPLVYCLESLDNPACDIFSARLDVASLHAEPAPDLLGGVVVLRGQTSAGQPVIAIPYPLWGNRGPSRMTVWMRADLTDF